jgi:hypothetical protein
VTAWARRSRLLLVFSCAIPVAGCGDNRAPPERLLDGSRATAPKVDLEGVDEPAIATKVDIATPRSIASCLGPTGTRAGGPILRRVGVNGISITFGTASGRGVYACDSSTSRPGRERWCGRAYGRLQNGALTDPRLDLTCVTEEGNPMAFVWIEPEVGTRYVVVGQDGFVEVYAVAGDLPVRVTTIKDIAEAESAASVDVSEHGRRGMLLRAYTLEARVAG